MLRNRLKEGLTAALKGKDPRGVATLRLILAGLKDRDIAARGKGNAEGIPDGEIGEMLASMVKQRRESIRLYEQGGRPELAKQEAEEIAVIESFMPKQMDEAAMNEAIASAIKELGAASVKDMGKVMAALRERYAGQMDFAKVSAAVRQRLA